MGYSGAYHHFSLYTFIIPHAPEECKDIFIPASLLVIQHPQPVQGLADPLVGPLVGAAEVVQVDAVGEGGQRRSLP